MNIFSQNMAPMINLSVEIFIGPNFSLNKLFVTQQRLIIYGLPKSFYDEFFFYFFEVQILVLKNKKWQKITAPKISEI